MAIEIVVPRLGWSMDEGTFGEWLKRDGEFVERGQALFVLEGEKSAQDIESFDEGILRIPPDAPQPGETVKVGQVLAYLVEKEEAAPFETTAGRSSPVKVPAAATHPVNGGAPAEGARAKAPVSPAADSPMTKVSPRARRLAAKLGIDAASVRGTGRTGRVRARDVAALANQQPAPAAVAHTDPTLGASRSAGVGPIATSASPIRRTIAARMSAAAQQAAAVTITARCDATNLVNLREQFGAAERKSDKTVPSYNDLIVKLTAHALVRHPSLRAQWCEQQIVVLEDIHIAVAVDTEAGLLAPVIRDVNRLTLRELAAESRRLAELARAGKLSTDQMQGGAFTVTNLGMFGIDAFTPIINLPQCAILGVGCISREPAVYENAIVPREQVTLSLTFDHRVVDGAPAARFLSDLREGIEQPAAWLVP
ncbi:MAG TPA: dihydrolipoamide acetyltransferase family protein [Planctomycetaceae bacterium]|nr:dihydrolipoamide acetyltransferase family protein [Planctomycetaceae bacterium]